MAVTHGAVRTRRRPSGNLALALTVALAAATIGLEVAYPLVDGGWQRRVTIAIVVAFFATCVLHAWARRGPGWALRLTVVTAGGGFVVEAIGVRTGVPFGSYEYNDALGPQLLGVPLVVALAWTMLSYPVMLAARRLTVRWSVLVGGFGLAAWDVFLDSQMVGDHRWRWADPTPALPGVPGVPLTNNAGWLLVGTAMMALLAVVAPRERRRRFGGSGEAVPAALLLWTWLGYVLGNLFWFGSPSVALVGGVLLGLVVLPYAWSLWQSRP